MNEIEKQRLLNAEFTKRVYPTAKARKKDTDTTDAQASFFNRPPVNIKTSEDEDKNN